MANKSDEQIRKAIEDGQFDHLPGKGKPLDLPDNPFEAPEWRMANKMLKDAGYTLPWIEAAKEIDDLLEAARADLGRACRWRQERLARGQSNPSIEVEWQRAVQAFRQKIDEINRLIFIFNLKAPALQVQRLKVDPDGELRAIEQTAETKPE